MTNSVIHTLNIQNSLVKIAFSVGLCLISFKANALIYYIDNAGNDLSAGTSEGTAWATIAKINSSTFAAGDQILFKAGGTWVERLNFPSSGSAGNHIIIGKYGAGLKPIISGFTTITGFTNAGNIWTATAASCPKTLNTVLIDGVLRAKGRYPNTTYLATSSTGTTTQVNTSLTGTPDYTGYGIVVRSDRWILDRSKISAQSTVTLTLSTPLTYTSKNGYFLQNHTGVLDIINEWSFDSTTNELSVYATSSPTVQASIIDTLVYISNKSYLTFDGIKFTGSNLSGIELFTTTNITIQNCTFDNNGQNAITETYAASGSVQYTYILNDTITNCLSGGIYTDPDISDSIVNCYIKNIGIYAGMGKSGNGTYIGIYNHGLAGSIAEAHIEGNRIDS